MIAWFVEKKFLDEAIYRHKKTVQLHLGAPISHVCMSVRHRHGLGDILSQWTFCPTSREENVGETKCRWENMSPNHRHDISIIVQSEVLDHVNHIFSESISARLPQPIFLTSTTNTKTDSD